MLDDFVRSVLAVSWWMRSTCRLDWSAAGLPFRISQTEVFGFLVKQHIGVGQNMSKPTILRYTKGKKNPHISINTSISIF